MVVRQRQQDRPRTRRWGGGKYAPKRRFCFFCADKVETIDYKDPAKLRRYILSGGKIAPRRRTGKQCLPE